MHDYITTYLKEVAWIADQLRESKTYQGILTAQVEILLAVRAKKGRVYLIGLGGSAPSASHSANDLIKIAGISTYCLTDNVGTLTAYWNDEGPEAIFKQQLVTHHFNYNDVLCVFSVGGGTSQASPGISVAIKYANKIGAAVIGVVGRPNGSAAMLGDAVLVVPSPAAERVTAHSESWMLVINHLWANLIAELSKPKNT